MAEASQVLTDITPDSVKVFSDIKIRKLLEREFFVPQNHEFQPKIRSRMLFLQVCDMYETQFLASFEKNPAKDFNTKASIMGA